MNEARAAAGGLRAYLHASLRAFAGIAGRALGQIALVLLLARLLGPGTYGRFVAVVAVASFLVPLAGLGAPGVLLREESRLGAGDAGLRAAALGLWWRTLLVLAPLGALILLVALPSPFPLRAGIALVVAEIASVSFVELVARSVQARGHLGRYGAAQAGLVWTRLLVLVGLAVTFAPHALRAWMWAYALSGLGYALVLGLVVLHPRPRRSRVRPGEIARRGWPFAAGSLGQRLQTEFNKPVLAYSGFADVAVLNVAQRAADVVALPLLALQEALWPRLYRLGKEERPPRWGFAVLFGVAVLAGLVLRFLAAPFLPLVFGSSYTASARLLGLLAFLPLFQVTRNTANVLAAARGRMRLVALAAGVGAGGGMALSLLLIPREGPAGAVTALYGAEIGMILVHLLGFRGGGSGSSGSGARRLRARGAVPGRPSGASSVTNSSPAPLSVPGDEGGLRGVVARVS